jgi:cysteine-rich repeat protein
MVDQGEACDGDITCESSPTGSFIDCSDDCQSIIDQGSCPTTTTTIQGSTTTTTVSSSTTTTTLQGGAVCGNGVVEEGEACDDVNTNSCDGCAADCSHAEGCGNGVLDPACREVCDGQDFGDATCPGGSPGGALLGCSEDCSTIDTSNCQPLETAEICGNCIDDDGNGLTDFEDPACCDGPQAFLGTLRKSNLKPRGASQSFLRIKSNLATSGFMPMPMNNDVFLQMRDSNGTEILCAKIPKGAMMMKGHKKVWKFWWDRKNKQRIASAQNIDDMKVAIKKNGTIKYAAYGKHVNVATPDAGSIMITVGFRDPAVGDSTNQCSSVTQPYRPAKKGALRFP